MTNEATQTPTAMWTPEADLSLFISMIGLRPVGIHKHFRMVNIYTRLMERLSNTEVKPADVWKRLEALYDMELLEEMEDENEEEEADADANADAEEEEENEDDEHAEGESRPSKRRRTAKEESEEPEDEEEEDDEEEEEEEDNDNDNDNDEDEDDEDVDDEADGEDQHSPETNIPPSSIGTVLDTSDPLFWRRANSEFALPWTEFGTMMVERAGAGVDDTDDMASAVDPASSKNVSPEPESDNGDDDDNDDGSGGDDDGDYGDDKDDRSYVSKRRRGRSSTPNM
ncbi:hypothetical protein FBU59_006027 [Linderina macrospora]|uniref:Uncharacterized protein n=1 Tax=Linderina macrospora TaxID=4868 RepID=A0ACC1J108_9FUNG|nr:hypothetical protein FBU59_006027 [Linderina macrospora]